MVCASKAKSCAIMSPKTNMNCNLLSIWATSTLMISNQRFGTVVHQRSPSKLGWRLENTIACAKHAAILLLLPHNSDLIGGDSSSCSRVLSPFASTIHDDHDVWERAINVKWWSKISSILSCLSQDQNRSFLAIFFYPQPTWVLPNLLFFIHYYRRCLWLPTHFLRRPAANKLGKKFIKPFKGMSFSHKDAKIETCATWISTWILSGHGHLLSTWRSKDGWHSSDPRIIDWEKPPPA